MTDSTKKAVAVFDRYAGLYQQKYMDVSAYGDSLRFFADGLVRNASVLELGCGPGNITRFLLDLRADLDILATDLAPNMLELAKQNNPEAKTALLDCREISTLNRRYDGIVCGFCLPYLSHDDAVALIANASKLLTRHGLLYLSTMEGDRANSGMVTASTGDQLFMHFYQADDLKTAFARHRFAVVSETRVYTKSGEDTITDLILVGKK